MLGDTLVNIRESILIHRISGEAESKTADLIKGLDHLER